MKKKPSVEETRRHRSACVEVGTFDKYSACVERLELSSTKHVRRGVLIIITRTIDNLRRGEISGINVFLQLLDTSYVRATRELEKKRKEIELQTAKNKALSLNPAAKVEEKQFETLNKETATHISIREAEDWFRPIDLAKECDIYISSRNGSHKETPITYGYTQDPFKNRSRNFKPEIKENYPQYLERENKNCFIYICGDSSHYARDCEKRFKPKGSNDHIHNRINVNTLKVESEKQNSDEFANLQYVHIFVENQPVTALIDSGCQIPVLNSSLIRVNQPSEEIITLSSCFGEQRMVEVKPINFSLNQHFPGLSVRTAISPTLTEEFIIHPSVYAEIKRN
ncbi:retrovirus-related Pol polyprotein from transposon opus [Trichonephila clavipes]|uniref:Retrovirus-related Pol polyprotein from transposon opus n=1 Tax=Trichonephila clavipes TaxID=2585209 RepID=A0A8X6VTW4_TRICX|nr:retrovirus-related Pol polyprotein from transposon opus [Trichonephila clavipes]